MPSTPKTFRAKRKPKKARRTTKKHRISAFDIADAMETPLNRAEDLVRALEYVGYGMSSLEEDGAPAVFALAHALSENLEAVKRSWELLYNEVRSGK